MLGLFLVVLPMLLLWRQAQWLSNFLPYQITPILLFGAVWAPPGIFGFWVGVRQTRIRLWSQIIPFGLLVGVIVGISLIFTLLVSLNFDISRMGFDFWGLFMLTIPPWLLFVSGSFIGNAWQRRRIGRISGTTPASPVSRTTQGAGQQPRKDLTPAQQAMLGWGGAIISALITLIGTIITVRSRG
jgi:hypothetical protein